MLRHTEQHTPVQESEVNMPIVEDCEVHSSSCHSLESSDSAVKQEKSPVVLQSDSSNTCSKKANRLLNRSKSANTTSLSASFQHKPPVPTTTVRNST